MRRKTQAMSPSKAQKASTAYLILMAFAFVGFSSRALAQESTEAEGGKSSFIVDGDVKQTPPNRTNSSRKTDRNRIDPFRFGLEAEIPDAKAKQIKDEVGVDIERYSVFANWLVIGTSKKFVVTTGLGVKSETKIPMLGIDQHFEYRYESLLSGSDDKGFFCEGYLRVINHKKDVRCYLKCRLSGKTGDDGEITATAKWTGPIYRNGMSRRTRKILDLIFEDE